MSVRRATASNRILRRLPVDEAALIEPLCDVIELVRGDVLCEAGRSIRFRRVLGRCATLKRRTQRHREEPAMSRSRWFATLLRPVTGFVIATLLGLPASAFAWGNEGHEIVGQIATHFLQPAVRQRVFALLAADQDALTAHDFVSQTTWADRFRDSDRNTTKVHFLQTRQWHFVDIELANADLDAACFGHPPLPAATVASLGTPSNCAVDKIDEFAAELRAPQTTPAERLVALKFLLHFVGDIHQPLHASDSHDAGGNAKKVKAAGVGTGSLHQFWDTQFVKRLGVDPIAVGDAIAARISPADVATWSQGTATDWARESFAVAKTSVYGKLPKPGTNGVFVLPASYVAASQAIVTKQLSRAGVRLATVLNAALDAP